MPLRCTGLACLGNIKAGHTFPASLLNKQLYLMLFWNGWTWLFSISYADHLNIRIHFAKTRYKRDEPCVLMNTSSSIILYLPSQVHVVTIIHPSDFLTLQLNLYIICPFCILKHSEANVVTTIRLSDF